MGTEEREGTFRAYSWALMVNVFCFCTGFAWGCDRIKGDMIGGLVTIRFKQSFGNIFVSRWSLPFVCLEFGVRFSFLVGPMPPITGQGFLVWHEFWEKPVGPEFRWVVFKGTRQAVTRYEKRIENRGFSSSSSVFFLPKSTCHIQFSSYFWKRITKRRARNNHNCCNIQTNKHI